MAGTLAGLAGALFAFLKGSIFPDSFAVPLSVDALVMVLIGGVGTVSGAAVGAVLYKTAEIWLISTTDHSKLVLGAGIVALVLVFPRGVVGIPPPCSPTACPGRGGGPPGCGRPWRRPAERPSHERRPAPASPRPHQALWRGDGGRRCRLRPRGRRAPGHGRPERRRQDHLLQHAQRPACARRRARCASPASTRPGCRRAASGRSGSAAPSRSPPPSSR